MKRYLIYGILAISWALFCSWQYVEHQRVSKTAKETLLTHVRDIARSLGVVIHSQSRFGATRKTRLERSLNSLVEMSELEWVSLQSPAGHPILTAGPAQGADERNLAPGTEIWDDDALTVVELIQLGYTNFGEKDDNDKPGRKVVLVEEERHSPFSKPSSVNETNESGKSDTPQAPDETNSRNDQRGSGQGRGFRMFDIDPAKIKRIHKWYRTAHKSGTPPPHPPWMTEDEFKELFKTHGLHKFMLHVSAAPTLLEIERDAWLRLGLATIGLFAVIGLGIAWHTSRRSAALALDLVRSQEANVHLREMNIAAAGLAHETRNPLNVVRGLAQLVSKAEVQETVKDNSMIIIEEVDRVNARLNEFIAYSKPREPKLEPIQLKTLAKDILRTLQADVDEKSLEVTLDGPELTVLADEGMLRQAIFNLTLNAIQAVDEGGTVQLSCSTEQGVASLAVSDNGSGVPSEARQDIFRPYFTLTDDGTGLGLAIVRQIAIAHSWKVSYEDSDNGGATFVISGLPHA